MVGGRHRLARFAPWLCAASLGACADDPGPGPMDAGADAGADAGTDADLAPLEPAPSASPRFAPCPEGWRELPGSSGFVECDPWPEGGPRACDDASAHLPGAPGCAPIGSPCPADGLPGELPADATVLYVRAGAAAGDGTRALPFGTVAEALAGAAAGTVVALATGAYDEEIILTGEHVLWGACAQTSLGTASSIFPVHLMAAGAGLRNLRVGPGRSGITVSRASVFSIRDVIVRDVERAPISILGGAGTIERVLVADVPDGPALQLSHAEVVLTGFVARQVGNGFLNVFGGSLSATDVASVESPGAESSFLVLATSSARVSLERASFHQDRTGGVVAVGSSLTLRDAVVEAPPPGVPAGLPGLGAVYDGALDVARVRLERPRLSGVGCTDPLSAVALADVSIRDVQPATGGEGGHGVEVALGARVDAARLHVERASSIGVLVTDEGTSMRATDLTVRDTLPDTIGTFGRGLQVQLGASVEAERVLLAANREATLVSSGPGTTVTLREADVTGTLERSCVGCSRAGIGAGAYLDGALVLERFRLTDHALTGLQLARGGQADLRAGLIAGNVIGANVQTSPFDLARITAQVSYRDNEVNLDATELPVPDSTSSPAGP